MSCNVAALDGQLRLRTYLGTVQHCQKMNRATGQLAQNFQLQENGDPSSDVSLSEDRLGSSYYSRFMSYRLES